MCGFVGHVALDGKPDLEWLRAAERHVAARGPDGRGELVEGPLALLHRRLAVFDPDPRAGQPMRDAASGTTLVYNGSLSNHVRLRRELEALGHQFGTTSDTEVVLRAYVAWGEAAVPRLEGMFAFAIHDARRARTMLVRDRFGIKPLYWAQTSAGLWFASRLPALLDVPGLDRRLDPQAIHFYLRLHGIVPPPRTIVAGVSKLAPGAMVVVERDGSARTHGWYALRSAPAVARGDEVERLAATLEDAIERELAGDVPIGVLLSGGLDSSLLVALQHRIGRRHIPTFSIGFPAQADEPGDEFAYSDAVATQFDTEHHRIVVDAERTVAALPDCIAAMSEPMVSHDAVAFWLLAAEVSRHVKVVHAGQGADEVFGGYHWYPRLLPADDAVSAYAAAFLDRSAAEVQAMLAPRWRSAADVEGFLAERFARPEAPPRAVDAAMWIDTTVMLPADPLARVDDMTMAWGLEARVPLLDRRVVELAATMPAELKLADGGKGVLKAVARDLLPRALVDRPKGYFPVPALRRLAGPLRAQVLSWLDSPGARARGLFDPAWLHALAADPQRASPLAGDTAWQLGVLTAWLDRHHL
jgi:asparagine synthase (glutamine-hydrolysing)